MKEDIVLKFCIDSVHKTISDCRSKPRNRAMLRNLNALVPRFDSNTRWSRKYLMLERFSRIYDSLCEVAETEESTVAMNLTLTFKT